MAPVASFILPPGSGPLLMEGSVPGWLPPPGGLELQLTVEGRDCGSHWLPAGDFRLEVPLPADVPETAARMTIKASRFLSPSRLGRSAERRRLAYQVRSIRRERESGGGEGSDAEAQSEPLLELPSGGRLLLVHTGGLGDLVLSSELIAGLKRERGLVVTLVCRAAVAAVPALFPVPPDRVVPIDFDPHTWSVPSPELFSVLEPVLEELRHLPSDAVVDGALRPTWFGWLATAVVGARSFLACGDSPEPGPLLDQVLDHFGLPRPLRTGPDSDPEIHERKRYRLLLRALGCQDAASDFPWRRPPGSETQTRRFLRDAGIEPGTYVACFPGGAATTHVKRWPVERFVEVLQDLQERRRLPVVLVGNASERLELERISTALGGRATRVAVFSGTPEEIPVLAGLLAEARLYLGNDTGPLHLASAYGLPGVGIYGGGGRWPSYAPWATGSIGLHHPLPCYGCGWDCFLGHGLCVESIPAQAVLYAVDELLAGGHGGPESRPLDLVRDSVVRMVADASARYLAAQADRAARLDVIVQLARAERATSEALRDREQRIEALERALARSSRPSGPSPAPEVRAFQIPTGLGAGNVGDELMARAFWDHLPAAVRLDVALFGEATRQHEPYPARHRTRPVDWTGNETAWVSGLPGLLVGGTPVAESEGLDFPLRFLEPRLSHLHRGGQPVDAVGVGVDRLGGRDAIDLFHRIFSKVRSWTVRSSVCREALLELGIEPGRVRVGADWAWLHRPKRDLSTWAAERWRALGVEEGEPLLAVNVVNMNWKEESRSKRETAAALDRAASELGLRIAFFCNDCRDGSFFDHEAARETAAAMETRAVVVPNEYFSPDEAVALLARATVAVGARYHFVVESVLAGTVPVPLERGQKMTVLSTELEIPSGGSVGAIDRNRLFEAVHLALQERNERLARLALRRASLARRAAENLSFLRELPPYALAWAGSVEVGRPGEP